MPIDTTTGRILDARPDRVDYRDRPYQPPLSSLPAVWPPEHLIRKEIGDYTRECVLDQGNEGACTGFGLAAMINFISWRRRGTPVASIDSVSPRMLYHMARIYDEWDGEDYSGSSCRGAMKGWHHHGVCRETLWPYRDSTGEVRYVRPSEGWQNDAAHRPLGAYYRVNTESIADMQSAIHEVGAVYVSATVHAGWTLEVSDSLPTIRFHEEATGGHAFCFVGYTTDGFIVQNSWGVEWGYCGFAILTYEDWVAHGGDAWVAAIGAPMKVDLGARTRTKTSLYELASLPKAAVGGAIEAPPEDPWTADWAYQHTVVLGNEGRALNRLIEFESAREAMREVAYNLPKAELEGSDRPRMMIFVHGGLNDEEASIERIRTMAPFMWENDVYPLFITWKTGVAESIQNMIKDSLRKILRLGPNEPDEGILDRLKKRLRDARDRSIEVACRHLLVKALWSEMKENAAAGAGADGGLRSLVTELRRLKAQIPHLEIHFAGHSAGSIIIGHLLDLMDRPRLEAASCTLWAPACTADFALEHYGRAHDRGVLRADNLHLEVMSTERELADTVGPYGKSLLYLISRALERNAGMPILGLQTVLQPTDSDEANWPEASHLEAVRNWRSFSEQGVQVKIHGLERKDVPTGCGSIPLAHGSFDNDIDVVTRLIERARGRSLIIPVGCLETS